MTGERLDSGGENAPAVSAFLASVAAWAAGEPGIVAVAVVGSHARGTATGQSDVDLVILTTRPQWYLDDTAWVGRFGSVARQQTEHYGRLTSLRVWYAEGMEVEFGITAPDWAVLPLDEGTRRVIRDGMRVLWERTPLMRPRAESRLSSL